MADFVPLILFGEDFVNVVIRNGHLPVFVFEGDKKTGG
jgi:hypothetical protein